MAVSIYKMGSENTLNAGQYVAEVLDFSSQYGTYDPAKYSYKAKNLEGKPRAFPMYGDNTDALVTRGYGKLWRRAPSGKIFLNDFNILDEAKELEKYRQLDFVDIRYERAVIPEYFQIVETLNPGALIQIWALVEEEDKNRWELIWSGEYQKPSRKTEKCRILLANIQKECSKSCRIFRLVLEQTDNYYYSELEAVKLYEKTNSSKKTKEKTQNCDVPVIKFSSNKQSTCPIDQLPIEVVTLIMKKLSLSDLLRFSQTSKRYHSILEATGRLDLSWCGLHQGKGWVLALDNFIKCLSITPRLTHFRLNNSVMSFATLDNLLKTFELEELSLEQTKFHGYEDHAEIYSPDNHLDLFRMLTSFPKSIISLNLAESTLTNTSLNMMVGQCGENLKHLNVSNCAKMSLDKFLEENRRKLDLVTLQAWKMPLHSAGMDVLGEMTNLEELDIGWSLGRGQNSYDFKEKEYKWPRLRKISLAASNLSEDSLIHIAKNSPLLEQIDLVGCPGVTKTSVKSVLDSCPKMQHLDASFCSSFRGTQDLNEAFEAHEAAEDCYGDDKNFISKGLCIYTAKNQ